MATLFIYLFSTDLSKADVKICFNYLMVQVNAFCWAKFELWQLNDMVWASVKPFFFTMLDQLRKKEREILTVKYVFVNLLQWFFIWKDMLVYVNKFGSFFCYFIRKPFAIWRICLLDEKVSVQLKPYQLMIDNIFEVKPKMTNNRQWLSNKFQNHRPSTWKKIL